MFWDWIGGIIIILLWTMIWTKLWARKLSMLVHAYDILVHMRNTNMDYNIFDHLEDHLRFYNQKRKGCRMLRQLLIEEFQFMHKNITSFEGLVNPDMFQTIKKQIGLKIRHEDTLVKIFVTFGYWNSLNFYGEIRELVINPQKRRLPKYQLRSLSLKKFIQQNQGSKIQLNLHK